VHQCFTQYDLGMKTIIFGALIGCILAVSTGALAQTSAEPTPANSMAAWLRDAYTANRDYLARTAVKMPEDSYGMRPGPQMEVRTFGQILGHLANFNFLWCSQAKGEKNPNQGHDFEKAATKADLVRGLNAALTYCDTAYSSLTDVSGTETIPVTQENGHQTQSLRMSLLVLNYGHNNEHYGNLVTYMRIKSIVPPSSEPPSR
jgi:uncharacterized damage-inducible protein DinB